MESYQNPRGVQMAIFHLRQGLQLFPLTSKTASNVARPHIRSPSPNVALLEMSSARRPRISVNHPMSGCSAAVAIDYVVASHDRLDEEEKEAEVESK